MLAQSAQTRAARRAFSLVEMAMVIATLAIIAMIAVPRLTRAASDAQDSALVANVRILQGAIDMYEAEHHGLSPAHNADNTVTTVSAKFTGRLLGPSDEDGGAGGVYGPYLLRVPRNPANGMSTVRIDGAPSGANLAGWRFDSTRRVILPDHLDEAAAVAVISRRSGGAGGAATLSSSTAEEADAVTADLGP